jgi:CheY-like chemotaxis protein
VQVSRLQAAKNSAVIEEIMRILVVEDDTVLADALTHTLRGLGYEVDCLMTGS